MVRALPIIVREGVTLMFQRSARLMFKLPACPPTAHAMNDGACVDPQGRHPTAVLDLGRAHLPGLKTMDSPVRVRCLAREVSDHATARYNTCGTVVPLIIRDTPGLRRRLHLLEQLGMIAFCDPADRVQTVRLQGLAGRGMRTPAVCSEHACAVWVVLMPLGNQPCRGLPFTSMFVRAIVLHHRFRHQRHHGTPIRMDHRRASPLMIIGDAPVAVDLLPTRRTVNRLGGTIPRALACQSRVSSEERHRGERLASLQLPKDALEQRA
jgi:hypothetical protein